MFDDFYSTARPQHIPFSKWGGEDSLSPVSGLFGFVGYSWRSDGDRSAPRRVWHLFSVQTFGDICGPAQTVLTFDTQRELHGTVESGVTGLKTNVGESRGSSVPKRDGFFFLLTERISITRIRRMIPPRRGNNYRVRRVPLCWRIIFTVVCGQVRVKVSAADDGANTRSDRNYRPGLFWRCNAWICELGHVVCHSVLWSKCRYVYRPWYCGEAEFLPFVLLLLSLNFFNITIFFLSFLTVKLLPCNYYIYIASLFCVAD